MPDCVVRGGTTARLGRVEGELKVGKNAKIASESGGKVVVTGGAYFEGPVTIDCDFECQSMKVEGHGYGPGGDVVVRGDLTVHGSADISASMKVDGEVRSEELDVSGHLQSGPITSKRVRVGGHLETEGAIEVETLDVGGHMSVSGEVKLVNLRVGGHAEVGGGTISGEIEVRGHFETTRKLAFGGLKVFGRVRLPSGSSGERLSAIGKVELEGDSSFKVLQILGSARATGSCTTENVEVNGKFDVLGFLRVSKKFEVYGTADVKKQIECESLALGGKLAAESIVVSDNAELSGDLETSRGLKAKYVMVRSGTNCRGPLVGERVDLGKSELLVANRESHWAGQSIVMRGMGRMTSAEDVHGTVVVLEPNSRCGRIFANRVELGEGCIVDEVTYTDEIKLSKNEYLHKPPVKTARLPNPPL